MALPTRPKRVSTNGFLHYKRVTPGTHCLFIGNTMLTQSCRRVLLFSMSPHVSIIYALFLWYIKKCTARDTIRLFGNTFYVFLWNFTRLLFITNFFFLYTSLLDIDSLFGSWEKHTFSQFEGNMVLNLEKLCSLCSEDALCKVCLTFNLSKKKE